ncbi:alkene reductase [Burkholderia gladioli]|uniref:alkene reductase n=1 Tax=Burkholderia gladioli TaxID=28095 RepID=UPI00163F2AB9|nr:alkene reductase [Burkholderia gladioli]
MTTIFDPLQLGELTLPNRILMAPLTRSRATGRVPNALMARYYAQRAGAGAGLIFTEATSVTPMGVGYADTPGIWNDEQIRGWAEVTRAVHEAGGRIVLQLWHVGRISHPIFLDGQQPVGPGAIAAQGHVSSVRPKVPYPVPRALEIDELPGIVESYRQGAANAKAAGFDGVLVHGANGYLLDQFLQSSANRRSDAYGGSIENRARLLLEVSDAVIDVWGAGRVGVHFAPRGDGGVGGYVDHGMGDEDLRETFLYVARELKQRGVAYLSTREKEGPDSLAPAIKQAFGGPLIANEAFTRDSADAWLAQGKADAVMWGNLFIANPDLPARLREDGPYNAVRREHLYEGGPVGYVDYPTLAEAGAGVEIAG